MLPLAGTPERAELEAEAHSVAAVMLDQAYLEISTALHRTFMHFRAKFLAERDVLDAENQGEAWHECIVDARQLSAYINDLWAMQIRRGHATAGAAH